MEADEPAGRHAVFEARAPAAVHRHVRELGAPRPQGFHDRALVRLFDIDGQGLVRLEGHAVDHLRQNLRARNGELVAFTAHGLEEDREMQLAASLDAEHVGLVRVLDAQGDVALQLPLQALAELTAGDELAFAPGERGGVHLEVHRNRRLVDPNRRQAFRRLRVAHGETNVDVLDAGHGDDVAGERLFDRRTLKAGEGQDLPDPRGAAVLVAVAKRNILAGTNGAAPDAADTDAADVGVVVERGDLKLQRRLRIRGRRRHVREDRFEQRVHVRLALGVVRARPALQRRGVDHREVELLVGGAELVEELERVVDDPAGAGARAVDLVHDDDGLVPQRERLARDEPRLRHRAFDGVHEQQHAVHHREHALDLPAEVRMARRVHDVDPDAAVFDGAVLGQDRDAALTLDVVGVHHALHDLLVSGEGAGLSQEAVDERRLAMVDVRNDRDVANGALHGNRVGVGSAQQPG